VIYIQRYCSSHMWSTFKDITHHKCDLHSTILLITHVIYIPRYCSSQMWSTFKSIAHHVMSNIFEFRSHLWWAISVNVDHMCDEQYLWITHVIYIQSYYSSHMWSTFKDIAYHTCDLHSKILLITHVIYIQRSNIFECRSHLWRAISVNVDNMWDEQYLWM
jgi:hypothetical protein